MTTDQQPVEHDPLSEEADLLTIREAQARVTERIRDLRQELQTLRDGGAHPVELEAVRGRLDHLVKAAERLGVGRA
ncbi:hypothetical protein [Streptomyces sp. WM6386]|uniref:hypothetical protein n=1 Tax=Streptomyces sp. WM6386 TaxID=1415558 RepID=UPI0006195F99|nr:hypothetical protein [Streptomyces sp. WM6386]KKD06668.1 hypothetical protein TN53_17895 [Streptomyces sp. WM6386]